MARREPGRFKIGIVVAALVTAYVSVGTAYVSVATASGASRSAPTPSGRLTLSGAFQDGSTLTATGVTWKAVAGSYQRVAYAWSACTSSSCGNVSIPSHQPYLDSASLGPGDDRKRIRVTETATDVLPNGNTSSATVSYKSHGTAAQWPAGTAPRVDFIYGVPQSRTASTREMFDLSPPHANASDGAVRVACATDSGSFSTACAASRSYLTPVLSLGTHTVHVRAMNEAGSATTSYTWKVVQMPAPVGCKSCFRPPLLASNGHPMSWDWQLQQPPDPTRQPGGLIYRTVDMFDVDGFANSSNGVVAYIHSRKGLTLRHEKAICYLSLGSWENFRPDEAKWPAAALGLALNGYANEHWVDVRQLSSLVPVIDARLRVCAKAGVDGVEVDNIDGWENGSGFPLTPQDTEAWLAQVANAAHALSMFVIWKNDAALASFGVRYFDGALAEQCFEYEECTTAQNQGTTVFPGLTCNSSTFKCGVQQFATAGKWVGEVEYKWGVRGEDGVVCDSGQRCTLEQRNGNYTEVPYATFCSDVYKGSGFSAWRASESDLLNGTESYYCWR
jgi:hypothetical protein